MLHKAKAADKHKSKAREDISHVLTSRRVRKMGSKANIWIENTIKAKTEISSLSRDASTTAAATAAFMERTEVSLNDRDEYIR